MATVRDLSKPTPQRQRGLNLLYIDSTSYLWYKMNMQQFIDQITLFLDRLSEVPVWKLVSFYTLLILIHIYLPDPLLFMRYVLSPVVTFLLFFISWIALRNLVRDWR